ncbi:MAG: hypothetical protein J6U22_02945 [Bacteroidaceae bacterium]|nr:hypothetical protein [Bacteroidaceae bacterium]
MISNKPLPKWLKDYIFGELGAEEKPDPKEFCKNLDSDHDKNRIYLGTYFPRSFAESFCIHNNLFSYAPYKQTMEIKEKMKILSFGCGTGGDVVGLVCAIATMLPMVNEIEIVAYDGNSIAIDHLGDILRLDPLNKRFNIRQRCVPISISSVEDLTHITSNIGNEYDFILSFKFVNELMQLGILGRDGFQILAEKLSPLLAMDGLMTLLDVRAEYCGEWQPKNLNMGMGRFCRGGLFATLLPIPCHFRGSSNCDSCFSDKRFTGSFTSKDLVTYRVLGHKAFIDSIYPSCKLNVTYIRNKDGMDDPCPLLNGTNVLDAFDINN